MIETAQQIDVALEATPARLEAALRAAPAPQSARPADVVRYVTSVQDAAQALTAAGASGGRGSAEDRKRTLAQVDRAIARQVTGAGRRLGRDRAASLATLNALFKLGQVPSPALDGLTRGQLVTATLFAPLDLFGQVLTRLYMPWQGKRFQAARAAGDNLFVANARFVGRLFWPAFSAYVPFSPGRVTAFPFRTSTGPGIADPELTTLKLDYSGPANPALLVHDVLDELVQLSGNYYLGKVYLRRPDGHFRLTGFFALRRVE